MPKTKPNTNRHFGLIMTVGFLVLGILIPLIKSHPVKLPLIAIAGVCLFFGLFFPDLLEKPRKAWIYLGDKLGHFNSRIIFSCLYLTLFSFVHLIFKITGRDKLLKNWKAYQSTFKIKSTLSSFSDPF